MWRSILAALLRWAAVVLDVSLRLPLVPEIAFRMCLGLASRYGGGTALRSSVRFACFPGFASIERYWAIVSCSWWQRLALCCVLLCVCVCVSRRSVALLYDQGGGGFALVLLSLRIYALLVGFGLSCRIVGLMLRRPRRPTSVRFGLGERLGPHVCTLRHALSGATLRLHVLRSSGDDNRRRPRSWVQCWRRCSLHEAPGKRT